MVGLAMKCIHPIHVKNFWILRMVLDTSYYDMGLFITDYDSHNGFSLLGMETK